MHTKGVDLPRPIRSFPFKEIFYLDYFEKVEGYHAVHTIKKSSQE